MAKPMIYKLVNPHDAITFEAENEKVAIAGCMLFAVVGGYYGLRAVGTDKDLCFFFPTKMDDEIDKHFGNATDALSFIDDHAAEIAAFFLSCIYGDRRQFSKEQGKLKEEAREQHRIRWNDKHRSSMSDVSTAAIHLIKGLRPKGEVEHENKN